MLLCPIIFDQVVKVDHEGTMDQSMDDISEDDVLSCQDDSSMDEDDEEQLVVVFFLVVCAALPLCVQILQLSYQGLNITSFTSQHSVSLAKIVVRYH